LTFCRDSDNEDKSPEASSALIFLHD